jgi:hypothetical protein
MDRPFGRLWQAIQSIFLFPRGALNVSAIHESLVRGRADRIAPRKVAGRPDIKMHATDTLLLSRSRFPVRDVLKPIAQINVSRAAAAIGDRVHRECTHRGHGDDKRCCDERQTNHVQPQMCKPHDHLV